jgi:hypothetical protein
MRLITTSATGERVETVLDSQEAYTAILEQQFGIHLNNG